MLVRAWCVQWASKAGQCGHRVRMNAVFLMLRLWLFVVHAVHVVSVSASSRALWNIHCFAQKWSQWRVVRVCAVVMRGGARTVAIFRAM